VGATDRHVGGGSNPASEKSGPSAGDGGRADSTASTASVGSAADDEPGNIVTC
jgi:hypothetical protein